MSSILRYFDLNRRRAAIPRTEPAIPAIGSVRGIAASPSAGADLPIWQQIVFYLGTVIGVVVSSAVTQFQAGEPPTLSITFTTVVIAAIVALVIIPNFYTKVIKEDSPFIVQLGLFVQNGVFWSVMLSAVGKTIS